MKDWDRAAVKNAIRGYCNGGRVGFGVQPAEVWHLVRPDSFKAVRNGYHNYPTMMSLCGSVVETAVMIRARAVEQPTLALSPNGTQRPCKLCDANKPFLRVGATDPAWEAATADLVSLYERLYPMPNLGLGDLAPLQQ